MRGILCSLYYLFSIRHQFNSHSFNSNNNNHKKPIINNKGNSKSNKITWFIPNEIPIKKNYTGNDERFNVSYNHTVDRSTFFHRIFYQWNLLQMLQDPKNPIHQKIDRLETDSFHLTNHSKYLYNLLNGGLMKDW
jgi:hypothetical protein